MLGFFPPPVVRRERRNDIYLKVSINGEGGDKREGGGVGVGRESEAPAEADAAIFHLVLRHPGREIANDSFKNRRFTESASDAFGESRGCPPSRFSVPPISPLERIEIIA